MKTTKEVYEAPVIQSVEVEVEQGFQMTGDPIDPNNGEGGGPPTGGSTF